MTRVPREATQPEPCETCGGTGEVPRYTVGAKWPWHCPTCTPEEQA